KLAADGKSETASFARVFAAAKLDERLKDTFELIVGNSDSAVGDSNRDGAAFARALQRDRAVGGRELERVGKQVKDDLLDFRRIGMCSDRFVAAAVGVFQLSPLELRADETLHLAQNLVEAGPAYMELHSLTVVETREVEDRGDETEQVVLTLSDASQITQLCFVERSVNLSLQQFGVAEYCLQRGPELVT